MLLTDYNVIHFMLEGAFDEMLPKDKPFCTADLDSVESSYYKGILSPNNTLLKVKIRDLYFIVKQPKYLLNGEYWQITFEAKFYLKFQSSISILDVGYNTIHNALILPFIKQRCNVLEFEPQVLGKYLADTISEFHAELSFNRNRNVKKFYNENVISRPPYYQLLFHFKNSLKNESYFNQIWFNNSLFSDESASFLSQKPIVQEVLKLNNGLMENEGLIHGDLHIRNLLNEDEKFFIIDFEYVTKGDRAWDVATVLESILSTVNYQDTGESDLMNRRKMFFNYFIDSYCQNFTDEEKRRFVSRVVRLWALKSIESLISASGIEGFNNHRFLIEKMLLRTESFIEYYFKEIRPSEDDNKWWGLGRL